MPPTEQLKMEPSSDTQPVRLPKRFDFIESSSPATFVQWQTACAYVKSLYLQHSYESCIIKCDELLKSTKIHDVHCAFLHFYAGLCHETLADDLGPEHGDFHSRLDGAEQHLVTALSILPIPHTKSSPAHARQGSYETFKKELALQQQRSSSESSRPDTVLSNSDSKSSQTTPASPGAAEEEDECPAGARGRYNRILLSLKPELEAHIAYIRALRQDSTEARGIISRSNSASGGENAELQEAMAKVAVKQRMADGRKRNWKRTRFSMIPQPQSWQSKEGDRSVSSRV